MLSSIKNIKRKNNKRPVVKPLKVFNSIIIDRSGSMTSMRGKHIQMSEQLLLNIKKQFENDDANINVTFRTFDDVVETLLDNVNAKDIIIDKCSLKEKLTPRNMTRFIDTVIEEVDNLSKQKKEYYNSLHNSVKKLNPKIVTILNVITDGEDNVSQNNVNDCYTKMKQFRENGGNCILMSANLDSQFLAEKFGFNKKTALTVHNSNENAIEFAFKSISDTQAQMSQGYEDIEFSDFQRSSSCPISNAIGSNTIGSNTIGSNNFDNFKPIKTVFDDDIFEFPLSQPYDLSPTSFNDNIIINSSSC